MKKDIDYNSIKRVLAVVYIAMFVGVLVGGLIYIFVELLGVKIMLIAAGVFAAFILLAVALHTLSD